MQWLVFLLKWHAWILEREHGIKPRNLTCIPMKWAHCNEWQTVLEDDWFSLYIICISNWLSKLDCTTIQLRKFFIIKITTYKVWILYSKKKSTCSDKLGEFEFYSMQKVFILYFIYKQSLHFWSFYSITTSNNYKKW